jgi:hypothetical protein
MKASLILLIAFVIILSQTGCSLEVNSRNISTARDKSPDIGDGGFVSADPCGPPCFFEIVPGTTTKSQAISLLQARELYSDCHEYDTREQGGVRGIACQNISIGLQNDFDIVENIGFIPAQTITVEKAITRHGEPSAVLVTDVSYAKNEFVTSMILYYDTINVELVLAEQNSGAFNLTPTTLVVNIGYSDEGSYNQSRRYSQDWKGYSTYEQWNP